VFVYIYVCMHAIFFFFEKKIEINNLKRKKIQLSTSKKASNLSYFRLSRSSMKIVGWCRLLSKEWNSLTINLHCQRTKIISGYFIKSMTSNIFFSSFVSIGNSNFYLKLSLDCVIDKPRYFSVLMIEFCDIICASLLQKTWFEILATGLIVIRSWDFHSSCLTMMRTSIPIMVLDDVSLFDSSTCCSCRK
jgi:hypothetical protein